MFTIATILMILLGILLIAAVLIQPGKGDMATSMSGFGNQLGSMFGSRRASDLLTKITIGLGLTIMVLSLVANKFLITSGGTERAPATLNAEKPVIPSAPVKTVPAQPAPANNQTAPAEAPKQ